MTKPLDHMLPPHPGKKHGFDARKTPFPFSGGKSGAAEVVWSYLGDTAHYVEPFMGSLAVLLRRPHLCNRPYHSETVNDLNGLLCNAWRAIRTDPEAVAEWASNPVCQADSIARQVAIVQWANDGDNLARLMGDIDFFDAKIAGWWIWGVSTWIGMDFADGSGAWWPDADGILRKKERKTKKSKKPGVSNQIPQSNSDGMGSTNPTIREPGVSNRIPTATSHGQGSESMTLREPGVSNQIPQSTSHGMGSTNQTIREPGVSNRIPTASSNGMGSESMTIREPGVSNRIPHSVGHMGSTNQTCREPGVSNQIPHAGNDGKGSATASMMEPGVSDAPDFEPGEITDFHPMTMPRLRAWLQYLSARLRHVRLFNSDWKKLMKPSVLQTINVRMGKGICGVFLDPPYNSGRKNTVYKHDDRTVSQDVQEWCIKNGDNPKYRIILCGFEGEHNVLEDHGWRKIEWYKKGFLSGGSLQGKDMNTDRLWVSPHCLDPDADKVEDDNPLFDLFGSN